jgi:hypothetical protein
MRTACILLIDVRYELFILENDLVNKTPEHREAGVLIRLLVAAEKVEDRRDGRLRSLSYRVEMLYY